MLKVIGVLLTIIVISGWQALMLSIKGLYWKLSSLFPRPKGEGTREEEDCDGYTKN